MKSIHKFGLLLLSASAPAWACQANPLRVIETILELGDVPVNEITRANFDGLSTTGYDYPDGIALEYLVATGALVIQDVTQNALFGTNQRFITTLDLIPTGNGQQTASIRVSTRCGQFPGPTSQFTVTYNGIGGGSSVPHTFFENRNTGSFAEPISGATGEVFREDPADLAIPGGPLSLELRRFYASYLAGNGVESALGRNWMHNFDLTVNVKDNDATVRLFRGKTVAFQLMASDSLWHLSGNEPLPYQLVQDPGGGFRFLHPGEQRVYLFSPQGALVGIQDRSGNRLTVTQGANGPTRVDDDLGRTLTFTYTGSNLTKVQDQAGRSVTYVQTDGNLTAVSDANGHRSTFAYTMAGGLEGLLTAQTRPAANRPLRQEFDQQGRVSKQLDSGGHALGAAYMGGGMGGSMGAGMGAKATEPAGGGSVTQTHDADFNLIAQTDAAGKTSRFTYDNNRRITQVTDRTGAVTRYSYDAASGRIASITDALGHLTRFTYAAATADGLTFHDLSRIDLPDGTAIQLQRDAAGRVTGLTDQAGQVWKATWNDRGQPLSLTNPLGGSTTYTYGNDGTVASIRTHAGDTSMLRYDNAKRLEGITHPDDATVALEYEARNRVVRRTDERGNARSAEFNDNDLLRSVTDARGNATSFSYDNNDRSERNTDALGFITQTTRDGLQRVQSVTRPEGDLVMFAYDTLNRPISLVDASGEGLGFEWNEEARLTAVTDALGRKTQLDRDALGQVTGATTAAGDRYTYLYDAMGRLTQSTNPLENTAQFQYDARGSLTGITLPAGIAASIGRNEMGAVRVVTDPNGGLWTNSYDASGRRVGRTDPLGRAENYEYDSRRRISRVTLPEGDLKLTFDAANHVTRRAYSDGTVLEYTYDKDGRMTTATGVNLEYDAAGSMVKSNGLEVSRDRDRRIDFITYAPGKTVHYVYNERGLLARVEDWVGGMVDFTYDKARELVKVAFPNGVTEDYTYDANGRLATIRYAQGGTELGAVTLTRDAAGHVTRAERSAAAIPDAPAGGASMAYDAAHQSYAGAYDALGRETADGLNDYTWDLASRLSSYDGPNGKASFAYDAFGQRIVRSAAGDIRNYVLNYALPLPSVAIVRRGTADEVYYVWLPNGTLLSRIDADNNRRFYHFDEARNTSFLTNDAGNVTDTYAYSPYGATVQHEGELAQPFTYQGADGVMQEGDTGLFYMRARYYDSATARFLSKDPVASLNPRAINPYQYAFANPLAFGDPSGADPASDLCPCDRMFGVERTWAVPGQDPRNRGNLDQLWGDYSAVSTNVEFNLRVTDDPGAGSSGYSNPLGEISDRGDSIDPIRRHLPSADDQRTPPRPGNRAGIRWFELEDQRHRPLPVFRQPTTPVITGHVWRTRVPTPSCTDLGRRFPACPNCDGIARGYITVDDPGPSLGLDPATGDANWRLCAGPSTTRPGAPDIVFSGDTDALLVQYVLGDLDQQIFSDGFESGDTSAWSAAVP